MLKRDQGITMLILMVMVILLILLVGVSVDTGSNVVSDVRIGRLISNMTMVQAKAKTIKEEYKFNNNNTDYLVGQNVGKMLQTEDIEISDEEIEVMAQDKGTTVEEIRNLNWYQWDRSVLESQGLDKNMLKNEEVFFVNYDNAEVIYSHGTSYDGSEMFYSMSGLKYLHK